MSGRASVEQPPLWKAWKPYDEFDPARYVCWASRSNLWSCNKSGSNMKAWDIQKGDAFSSASISVHGLVALTMQPTAGLLIAAHEAGILYFDIRTGKTIRQQYTKNPVHAVCVLPEDPSILFAGVGSSLVQYETRIV